MAFLVELYPIYILLFYGRLSRDNKSVCGLNNQIYGPAVACLKKVLKVSTIRLNESDGLSNVPQPILWEALGYNSFFEIIKTRIVPGIFIHNRRNEMSE